MYQSLELNKLRVQNLAKESGLPVTSPTVTSDLELRIRKEIIDAVNNIWHEMETSIIGQPIDIVKDMTIIKDRLNLLWGELMLINPTPLDDMYEIYNYLLQRRFECRLDVTEKQEAEIMVLKARRVIAILKKGDQ